MSAITSRALELCRGGLSPSDAAVMATMGRSVSPAAIARIEMLCSADLRRRQREAAARRAS